MSVCYIFSGGVMNDGDLRAFGVPEPDFVISADAGYVYAKKYGYKSDCLIGDFDTLEKLPDNDETEIVRFKREKDDTDTMLAIKLAIEKGFDRIIIFGALGGRFDHAFANIQALNYISEQEKIGEIVSENEFITVLNPGEYLFPKREGCAFSAFSFSEKALGVCEEGFRYTLSDAVLEYGFPLGVCNEITEDFGRLSFKKGKILIVISKNTNHFSVNE